MADVGEELQESDPKQDPGYVDFAFRQSGRAFARSIEALREVHEGLSEKASLLDSASQFMPPPGLMHAMGPEGRERLSEVLSELFEDGSPRHSEFLGELYDAIEHEPWGIRVFLGISETLGRHRREPIFHSAMLTSAVSSFGAHLTNLAYDFFYSVPSALNKPAKDDRSAKDDLKEFSLADLQRLGSVQAAVESLIEARVLQLSYGSLSDWRAFFKDRLKIDLAEVADWSELREIHERRNCVVHHDGIASPRYVGAVGGAIEVGGYLEVDLAYVNRAITVLESAGLVLLIEIWRKLCSDPEAPATFLSVQGFEAMKVDRWAQSLAIHENLLANSTSEADRLVAQVNVWLSLKNLNGLESVQSAIDAWDTSAASDRYLLAKAALLDDVDLSFALIERLFERDELSAEELATWPLLRAVREDARIEKYGELLRGYAEDEGDEDAEEVGELIGEAAVGVQGDIASESMEAVPMPDAEAREEPTSEVDSSLQAAGDVEKKDKK